MKRNRIGLILTAIVFGCSESVTDSRQTVRGESSQPVAASDDENSYEEYLAKKEAAARQSSLCRPNEAVLFDCEFDGGSRASVCGEAAPNQGKRGRYKSGTEKHVEFEYPNARSRPDDQLLSSSQGWAGGGESRFGFNSDGRTYEVYTRSVRTKFDDGRFGTDVESGIRVQASGRLISRRICSKTPVPVDLYRAKEFIPTGQHEAVK